MSFIPTLEISEKCAKCNKHNKFIKLEPCECGLKYHSMCKKGYKCSCNRTFLKYNMKNKLYPFQQKVAEWMQEKKNGALLALDMGLGKTMLMINHYVNTYSHDKKHIIVLPKSLLMQWYNSILAHTNLPKEIITLYYGPNRTKNFTNSYIIITTYSICHEILDVLCQNLINGNKENYQSILLDECHMIRNHHTQIFKTIHDISRFVKEKWLLSGTPIVNSKNDYNNLARLFDISLEDFHSNFVYSLHKKDLELNLPKKVVYNYYIELSKKHYEIYNQLKNDDLTKIVQILRLRQASIHPDISISNNDYKTIVHDCIENKFRQVINIIKDIKANNTTKDDSVIIFSQFDRVKDYTKMYLIDSGVNNVEIYNGSLNQFNDEKPRILICNTKSCNYGLNLQKANHIIFIDQPWNPATYNQAVDRCYRLGQLKKVHVYNLYSYNTIDNWMIETLNKKNDIVSNFMSNEKTIDKTAKETLAKLLAKLTRVKEIEDDMTVLDDEEIDDICYRNDIEHINEESTIQCSACSSNIKGSIFVSESGTIYHVECKI